MGSERTYGLGILGPTPFTLIMVGAGLLSGIALWVSFEPWGIGVVHDSVFYLSGAENLSAGRGLEWNAGGEELRPLVHFPPGYSIVLSALGGTPASALLAASAIQIAALATTVVLIGQLIFLGSGNRAVSLLGAAIAGASPILFERYLDVRTEAMFLVFLLGSIAALIRFMQTEDDRLIWGAGALTAAAGAFRYAGLAALGAGVLSILIVMRGEWKGRIIASARFALIPTALFAVIAIRNFLVSGTATNRVFAFHPPAASVFRQGAVSISEWILPASIDPVIRLAVLAAFGIAAVILVRYRKRRFLLFSLLAVYAFTYSVSLIISLTFFDGSIRLDNRILVILYLYSLVAGFTVLGKARLSLVAMALALLPVLVIYMIRTADLVAESRSIGRGFTSRAWQSSPTIKLLDEAAPSGAVYSNEAQAIYSLLSIYPFPAPERTDPVKGAPRAEYEPQLEEMRLRLTAPESALVLFHPDQLREGMPTLDELTDGLVLSIQTADAALYVDPRSTSWP